MTPRELIDEHGSPLWLVDLDRVRRHVREFRATWERRFEEVDVAYSYKTNRLPAILLAVADEGAAPEVVSYAEYVLAREVVGAPGESIVVNGPAKPDRLLQRAGEDDALVIVDGADELRRAAAAFPAWATTRAASASRRTRSPMRPAPRGGSTSTSRCSVPTSCPPGCAAGSPPTARWPRR
jgi:diaminopimelate decarboxylase